MAHLDSMTFFFNCVLRFSIFYWVLPFLLGRARSSFFSFPSVWTTFLHSCANLPDLEASVSWQQIVLPSEPHHTPRLQKVLRFPACLAPSIHISKFSSPQGALLHNPNWLHIGCSFSHCPGLWIKTPGLNNKAQQGGGVEVQYILAPPRYDILENGTFALTLRSRGKGEKDGGHQSPLKQEKKNFLGWGRRGSSFS